ncbi:hypothetical protein L596_010202 [Steinernema carpocapsae]|uniref:glutathione transferase n=1 Tax=Steinernema carpocapsae TaxID=34508 RepID=A0A4U5PHM7_STECR|nr:hypothetical protein L596_010202 [Steinernema carpocapsae]
MSPKFELIYFNVRGYGEAIRLLFADQGKELAETRYPVDNWDEWSKAKDSFPFGQVPCLVEDGKRIVQFGTIMRHLSRAFSLNGDSEDDETYADMFFEGLRDAHKKWAEFIYGDFDDPETRATFFGTTLPTAVGQLQKLFATREKGQQFVLGKKISYVDYYLFEVMDVFLNLDPTTLDNFPLFKVFHERFGERPNLKRYLEKRAASGIKISGNGRQ